MEAVVQCFFCVLAAVGENNPGDVVVVCVHTFRLSSRESDELLFVVNETWCCRPLSSWDLKRRTSLLFMQMPFDATWTTARWEKTWMKCRHNYDCYPPRGSTDEARHLIIDRKTQFVSLNNAFFSVFLSETGCFYFFRPVYSMWQEDANCHCLAWRIWYERLLHLQVLKQLDVNLCYICCFFCLTVAITSRRESESEEGNLQMRLNITWIKLQHYLVCERLSHQTDCYLRWLFNGGVWSRLNHGIMWVYSVTCGTVYSTQTDRLLY